MSLKSLRNEYKQSLKSLDTEEHIDLMVYRPLGFMVAKVSAALHITPNMLTILSIILGIGAGLLFYPSLLRVNVAGLFLLMAANTLDSADGQLARMTKQYSRIGRILDGMAGDLWFITIYIIICLREIVTSQFFMDHLWAIWVLGAVAGASHIYQAQMADYYRQFHLSLIDNKDTVSELENVQNLERQYRELSWKKNPWKKFMLKTYASYSRRQASSTPQLQKVRTFLSENASNPDIKEMRAQLRAQSVKLMKFTNILSFNWRFISLSVSILLCMPWIYFALEITVFNAILVYMKWRHEKMCRNFLSLHKA